MSRLGLACGMPKESRLDGRSVLGRYVVESRLPGRSFGVVIEDTLLPPVRFLLLRIVMVFGMDFSSEEPLLGDVPGGVLVGAGSLDRTECTLCSSRCILFIKP